MQIGRTVALFAITAAAVTVVVGGCQGYNFNPVGSCIIQPGSKQVTLEDVTTADIVFVVDDSASMTSKQAALAANFNVFINQLNQSNVDRVNHGLEPYDFHIAVTTSSIYWADVNSQGSVCLNGSTGTQCCKVSSCSSVSSCTPGSACGSGGWCTIARSAIAGPGVYPPVSFDYQCCSGTVQDCQPQSCFPGDVCPSYTTTYTTSDCTTGLFQQGAPYPSGAFVAAPGNPKVLHFTKNLYTPQPNTAAIAALTQQFEQNIQVGNCGSPQEQHLEAARLAMQKVLAGAYGSDMPHLGAKLIVVWVGDEDDCSSPGPGATNTDAGLSIVLQHSGDTGADECVADKNVGTTQNPNVPMRAFPVGDYDSYFASLVAPNGQNPTASQPYRAFSAAFIAGTVPCVDSQNAVVSYAAADQYIEPVCGSVTTPGYTVPSASCPADGEGIWAGAVRFSSLADSFTARGYSVVEDTVCDSISASGFGNVLSQIANLVSAPSALMLASQPAASEVTLIQIQDSNGEQVEICPQALTQAATSTAGWWFMDCGTPTSPPPPVATDGSGNPLTTACIYINHDSGACEANAGQTYSAEYLGQVPPGGCQGASQTAPPLDLPPPAGSVACFNALKGAGSSLSAADWWCYGPNGGTGTCVCNTAQ